VEQQPLCTRGGLTFGESQRERERDGALKRAPMHNMRGRHCRSRRPASTSQRLPTLDVALSLHSHLKRAFSHSQPQPANEKRDSVVLWFSTRRHLIPCNGVSQIWMRVLYKIKRCFNDRMNSFEISNFVLNFYVSPIRFCILNNYFLSWVDLLKAKSSIVPQIEFWFFT